MKMVKRNALLAILITLCISVLSIILMSNTEVSSSVRQKEISNVGTITIGSKEFTEELILGNMMKILLEHNGFSVNDRLGLSGTITNHMALINGNIDGYMEYTGTAYVVILKQTNRLNDPQKVYDFVKDQYKKKWNLVWLDKAKLDNTNSLIMRKDESDKLGIKTISDLTKYIMENPEKMSFATNAEFLSRPDGLASLEEYYNFTFPDYKIIKMDIGLTYLALNDKKVDIAMGFSTDASIKKFNLITLDDDKKFFPVYNPAPVMRGEILEKYPQIDKILNQIGPRLTTDQMMDMNYMVEVKGKSPSDVAREWLQKQGLVDSNAKTGTNLAHSSLGEKIGYIGTKTLEHLEVSTISVIVAIPIGLGIGTVLAYFQKNILSSVVLNIATVVFTIPSIAMFGFMMPLFGLGLLPSVIVLVLYAQIPILRNTYAGLSNVSQNIIIAAEGIGVGRKDILFKIRFPATLPIIMAGIRNSVVLTIGIATIASLIGAGGLGDLILHGIQQSNTDLILAGTLPVAILAILADVGLKSVEEKLTSKGIR